MGTKHNNNNNNKINNNLKNILSQTAVTDRHESQLIKQISIIIIIIVKGIMHN